MRRTLLWAACSILLLAGGLALYLGFAYAVAKPDDAESARELRTALSIYGRLVLVRGLLPQLLVALAFGALLERRFLSRVSSRRRLAVLLALSALLAGVLVVPTLLPANVPGTPRVVFSGTANLVRTLIEMSAAVTAALLLPRLALPRALRAESQHA